LGIWGDIVRKVSGLIDGRIVFGHVVIDLDEGYCRIYQRIGVPYFGIEHGDVILGNNIGEGFTLTR
jgi:hypothetical protein